jgi:hypothetical protein
MSRTRSRLFARAGSLLLIFTIMLSSIALVKPAEAAVVDGATPGTNMIMTGDCLKFGVKSNGTLGVGGNTTPGIQYDNTCTGTFDNGKDFLTPGSPWEQLSVVLDGTNYFFNNDGGTGGWSSPTRTITNKSGVAYRGGTWDNRVVTVVTSAALTMENDIRYNNADKILEITTIITPATNITTAFISRGIDSDAVVAAGDSAVTNNARGYGLVTVNNIVFSETTISKAVMGYYTGEESNVTTGISNGWIGGAGDAQKVFEGTQMGGGNGDNMIAVAKKFTGLTAGTAYTFNYAYIFGPSAYDALNGAITAGAAGGTPGKVPGCTVTPDEPCTFEDVGSAVMTNTPRPRTATPSRTLVVPSSTNTPTASNTAIPTNTSTVTNTASPTNTFTPTPHPFAIKDVAVGASFSLAVLNNGTLATWGFNRDGQASLPRWMATKLVDQVETGSNYALALGTDGRVYGWGKNDFGQLTIPTAATSGVRSISAGLGHVMAIKTNGSLLIWGRNDFKQTEAPLAARTGLTAVAAGHSHSLAVKSGKVIAWGRNTWGQTNVPSTLTNVIAVAGGFDHSLALRSNGSVVCWGRNNENQCRLPNGMKDVIAISAGVGYSLALTRDGVVYAWGRNNLGQAKIPNGINKAGAISAGYVNSVIGLRDASVVAFGDASLGALVSRTPTVTP